MSDLIRVRFLREWGTDGIIRARTGDVRDIFANTATVLIRRGVAERVDTYAAAAIEPRTEKTVTNGARRRKGANARHRASR